MLKLLLANQSIFIICLMTLYGIIGGISSVLSKKGIIEIGGIKISRSFKMLFKTINKLLQNPLWLLGAILGVIGFSVYLIALQNFELSIVKPLINTNLVFTFIFSYLVFKEKLTFWEWDGVGIIIIGTIILGIITVNSTNNYEIISLIFLFPLTSCIIIVIAITALTEKIRNQEFFYSISSGLFYGIGAIFSKAILISLSLKLWVFLIYCVIMFGATYIVAIISQQFAFNSGRLSVVNPISNSISIIIPVISSSFIFYEIFSFEKLIGLICILIGVFLLRRDVLVDNTE